MKQKREMREAIRGRIRDFAAARDLSAEDIKPAMTTKHFELAQFAEKYSVSIEWLIIGKGRIAHTHAKPAWRRPCLWSWVRRRGGNQTTKESSLPTDPRQFQTAGADR
jgi:hypothetical protein